jgi:hypothetical protein
MDMQDKILKSIKGIVVTEFEYDFVRNGDWANTGTVYIQMRGGFENVLNFHYNFQDGYASLQFYPGDKEPVGTCGFTHKDCIFNAYFHYNEHAKIANVLQFVREQLKKQKKVEPLLQGRDPVKDLVEKFKRPGVSTEEAIRSVMVSLIGICGEEQLPSDDLWDDARDMFEALSDRR